MPGDTPEKSEDAVRDGTAWRAFCRALEKAGEVVLGPTAPTDALTRAEGFRYLTRLLRAGLESQLEFADPAFPGFFQLANETIKIGNDNPDNLYLNANIRGTHRYRITGTRGTVPYLSFGTKGGGYESDGTMVPTGQLDGRELRVDADGRLEITVSVEPADGNWLPMQQNTTALIVRQTFDDRRREEPARLAIACLDPEGTRELRPEQLEAGLERAVAFVEGTASMFVGWMDTYASHPNALPSDDQAKCQRAGGDANIHYLQSRWSLAPDEALLIEAKRLPRSGTWNFQLSNFWMESLDYRHSRIHLNAHQAALEPDGSLRIVVAHDDPGPAWPNRLETAGHREGGMLFRWIEADEHPPVEARVVRFDELASLAS
jgi:hypothetical protein